MNTYIFNKKQIYFAAFPQYLVGYAPLWLGPNERGELYQVLERKTRKKKKKLLVSPPMNLQEFFEKSVCPKRNSSNSHSVQVRMDVRKDSRSHVFE